MTITNFCFERELFKIFRPNDDSSDWVSFLYSCSYDIQEAKGKVSWKIKLYFSILSPNHGSLMFWDYGVERGQQ